MTQHASAHVPAIASEDAWPDPKKAWYVVFLLLACYSLSFADRMLMSLLIEPIKHDLAISDFQVSLLIGFAFASFYVLMGIPFGLLADRVNRRNLIVSGILVWSVATFLCGVADSFLTLFLARMAIGAGEATLSPSAYSMLGDLFPRHRLGRAISVYVAGNPLGTGLALMLGSVFIAVVTSLPLIYVYGLGQLASWRVMFIAMLVPGLVLCLLLFTVADPERKNKAASSGQDRGWNEGIRHIVQERSTYFRLIGGVALLSAAVSGSMAWIPTFFLRSHHMPTSEMGVYYGVMIGVGGVLGLLGGGALGDRLVSKGMADGHLRTLAWATAFAIIPFTAAPLLASPAFALVSVGLGVVATSMTGGVSAAAIQLITPGHLRGQVSAVYILVASITGIGLGPTLVAAMTDYVFHDEMALGRSLALLGVLTLPPAALLLFSGLPRYRSCLDRYG